MAKFDIRTLHEYLKVIDLTKGLQVRNALSLDEADNITRVTKDQLGKYIESIYPPEPVKKPEEPKPAESPETPATGKPDKETPKKQ